MKWYKKYPRFPRYLATCGQVQPQCCADVLLIAAVLQQGLMETFGAALLAESAGAVLSSTTGWEDLEIQEESESGNSITSKIRLPVQVRTMSQEVGPLICRRFT